MKIYYPAFDLKRMFHARQSLVSFFTLVFLISASPLVAIDYYWVGGSGMWSEHNTHWATTSGGAVFHNQVPTSIDDVHFDANSFPSGGTVTVDETIVYCHNMDWTDATNTPELTGTSSKNLYIYGSLTFISAMTQSFSGRVYFQSTQTGNTVTTAGKTFSKSVSFDGVGGEWTLLDDFTVTASVGHTEGTLLTDGQTFTVNSLNSNGVELDLGSSTVNITDSDFNISFGTVLNAGTSHVYLPGLGVLSGSASHVFYNVTFQGSGGLATNISISQKLTFQSNGTYEGEAGSEVNEVEFQQIGNINTGLGNTLPRPFFNIATFLGNGSFIGNSTFMTLNLAPGYLYSFKSGKTTTIAPGGTLNASGPGCNNYITLIASTAGSEAYLNTSGANFALQYVTVMDMAVTGGGTVSATNSVDLGNNTNWAFSPPASRSLFWVGGDGNWDDVSHWSLSSGGAGGECIPSAFDDVFFDQNSGFNAGGQSVTVNDDIAYCRDMTWSNVTNSPTFKTSGSSYKLYIYGSLALDPGMVLDFNGEVHFRATTTGKTVLSAGKAFSKPVDFDGAGGEWTLLDDFTANARVRQNAGALRTDGNTFTVNAFNANGAELDLGSSIVNITQSDFSITATLDAGTSHVYLPGLGVLSGSASHVFYNVTFQGSGGLATYISISQKLTFQANSTYEGEAGSEVNEVEFQQNGTINGLGNTLPQPYFNIATFLGNGSFVGNSTFMTLNLAPGFLYGFKNGKTTTIASGGSLNASGPGCNNYITLVSTSAGNQAFLNTSGVNIALDYVTVRDLSVTGGGAITATNSIDLGNNTNWTFSPPTSRSLYWVGGDGNWDDVSHWSLSSGGAGGECIPSAFDDVFFDQNSGFNAGGQFVSVNDDIAYCRDMTWSNVTNSPTFKVSSSAYKLNIYGSLALDPGMILSFNGEIYFLATSTGKTVLTSGKTFIKSVNFDGVGGEWTLLDDITATARIKHNAGTLHTGGNTITVNGFNSSGDELDLGSSTVNIMSSDFTISSGTVLDAGTSHIYFMGTGALQGRSSHFFYNVTFQGGLASSVSISQKLTFQSNGTYEGEAGSDVNEVEFQQSGSINGLGNTLPRPYFGTATFLGNGNFSGDNTFENLTFSAGKTYILRAGKTQTITPLGNFVADGTGAFPIEIKSHSLGNQATLHKDGDPICLDFLYLTDIAAEGAAFTYAGANSDDVFNNSGWLFQACPAEFYAPPEPAPALDAASVLEVPYGQQAALILEDVVLKKMPPDHEAVWFDEDLTTELYANAANFFQPVMTETTTFKGAFRNLTTGCVSELITVTVTVVNVGFSGNIKWHHDGTTGVQNVSVSLTGGDTGSGLTDVDGNYALATAIPNGSNYTLTPTKSSNKLNGITVADATAIQRHAINMTPITDPYRYAGADVNKSNSITTLDATIVNQSLLGNPAALNQFKTSWRFVPTSHTMTIPPWGFPEKIELTGASGNQANLNFFGIKTGDVVSSYADPSNFDVGNPLVINVQDQKLQSGTELLIEFRADQLEDLAAFQFALHFDPAQLQFVEVLPMTAVPLTVDNFGLYNISEGEIRVVWSQTTGLFLEESAPVFALEFNVLQDGGALSEALSLDPEDSGLPGYAYNSALAESDVELHFLQSTEVGSLINERALQMQVRPNPFRDATTVTFTMPEACEAQLRVLDVNGRELWQMDKTCHAGTNSETLRLESLSATGILYCELVTPFGVATQKMIILR